MLYALIDNATLTAVQRALGSILIKNTDSISGDLAALESLVQAILFYDTLICIDNYKEEYQGERKKKFSYIKFLEASELGLSEIETVAKNEVKSIKPEIRGGEFVDDDFKHLLELLKMNIVCTWDLQSSVYYLTMKMLGQPNTDEFQKYSELSSAIFNEMSDAGETKGPWSEEVKLFGSDGKLHTIEEMKREAGLKHRGKGGTTRALEIFIASLNWLAYKSVYYSVAAKILNADTFLHPIRHGFQIHWMKKSQAYGHDFTAKLIESLSGNINSSVAEIIDLGRNCATTLDLPVFSAWLTSKTGDVREVINAALDLKNTQEIQDIGGLLQSIRVAYNEEGLKDANIHVTKWNKQLEKASASVKRLYGIDTGQGIQISPLIHVYNAIASFSSWPLAPELEFKVRLPEFMRFNTTTGFSNVYKDIAKELTSFDRLGTVRNLMSERFIIDKDAINSSPKTEKPEFRYVRSDWKIPM